MKSRSNCSIFKTSPKLYQALILVFGNHSSQDLGPFLLLWQEKKSCTEKLLFKGPSVGMTQQGGGTNHVKDLAKADSNPRASTITRPFLGGRAASPRTQAASRGTLATPKTEF